MLHVNTVSILTCTKTLQHCIVMMVMIKLIVQCQEIELTRIKFQANMFDSRISSRLPVGACK